MVQNLIALALVLFITRQAAAGTSIRALLHVHRDALQQQQGLPGCDFHHLDKTLASTHLPSANTSGLCAATKLTQGYEVWGPSRCVLGGDNMADFNYIWTNIL